MKFFLIPLLLAKITCSLLAQDSASHSNSGIQIRGFAVAYIHGIDKVELRQESRLLLELTLATDQLDVGQSVKVRQFFFGITKGQVFVPMGEIKLPDVGRNFILVFVPTKDSYRVFPVRADDPDFKGNDALLFNFTPYRVHVMLGTNQQTINSAKSAKLRPSYATDATFYRALFACETTEGDIIPFSNTRWPVNENLKALVFVSMDAQTNSPVYRSVVELAGPAAP